MSGLLPAFNLVFSVELNLLSTLLCAVVAALDSAVPAFVVASVAAADWAAVAFCWEPVVLSRVTESLVGIFPSLNLFSLVLSSELKTLLTTLLPEPILNVNLPSVLSVGNVTLLAAS